MQPSQSTKAQNFRAQHHAAKLLVLPNIWDALGARLMQEIGYPSVATASVATAIANGYKDGEHIPFSELLNILKKIAHTVSIPVSVDIERGFAASIDQLKENIHQLIEYGAVGINIEDSRPEDQGFYGIDEQCRKIQAIRETADLLNVPLVVNARTDYFLVSDEKAFDKAIERAKAYQSAGADCIYPIMISSYDEISRFVEAVNIPVNVNLLKSTGDLKKLEEIGVARVSVGPQILNHMIAFMKEEAEALNSYDTSVFFARTTLPRAYLNGLTTSQ